MNLKQFLKPDWNKLIIFILLGPIGVLLMDFSKNYIIISISFLINPFVFIYSSFLTPQLLFTQIFAILDSLYLYVVSCLIVFIYDKVKKK